eukprot:m.109668 g.109668  ORF g.109668 m.109668 type:complete len:227 (+) comp9205_c2_seq1:2111-2791(+)
MQSQSQPQSVVAADAPAPYSWTQPPPFNGSPMMFHPSTMPYPHMLAQQYPINQGPQYFFQQSQQQFPFVMQQQQLKQQQLQNNGITHPHKKNFRQMPHTKQQRQGKDEDEDEDVQDALGNISKKKNGEGGHGIDLYSGLEVHVRRKKLEELMPSLEQMLVLEADTRKSLEAEMAEEGISKAKKDRLNANLLESDRRLDELHHDAFNCASAIITCDDQLARMGGSTS